MVSGEKRNCEEENALEKISAILLDIEGTTTSISFVKDTLFPYVCDNLKSYVESHWNDDEFQENLKAFKLQAKKDEEDKIENFCPIEEGEQEKETLIKNVLWQMSVDRKTTALKQLQGHIWREGYANGKLKGHIYNDIPQMFKKWCEDGRKLYIYSSGSVEAQKLLFKNSEGGDLSEFLSGYFDTETGPKTETSSYTSIAKAIECDAAQILFLTDAVKEAVAADKAGLQVMIVTREGNAPITDDERKAFTTITSFNDIVFESSSKKKKICEENVRLEGEQTQHVEVVEEPSEVKNGEPERMEVEDTDAKTEESNTEETEQDKTEIKTVTEPLESENIVVDVDDEAEEKAVSSTHEGNDENGSDSVEATENTEITDNAEVAEPAKEGTPVAENDVKEKEVFNGEAKAEVEVEKEEENEEVSMNGHENGENKENNEENNEKPVEENKGDETNGKVEEEIDAIPVKKVTGEEQADSTVKVIA